MKISEVLSMQYCGELVHTGVCETTIGDLRSRIDDMRNAANFHIADFNMKYGNTCGMFEYIDGEIYTVNDVNHIIAEQMGMISSNPMMFLVGVVENADDFVNVGSLFRSVFDIYDFEVRESFDFTYEGENLLMSVFSTPMLSSVKFNNVIAHGLKKNMDVATINEIVGFMESNMLDPEFLWDHILLDMPGSAKLTFQFAYIITDAVAC